VSNIDTGAQVDIIRKRDAHLSNYVFESSNE
jgi:hypothetical protein